MKVLNIHKRILNQPKSKVVDLFKTLSFENDKVWPYEKWPKMKFKSGIKTDAKGGHGLVRYSVDEYNPESKIQFQFSRPKGFYGVHRFEIIELETNKIEVAHIIEMKTSFSGGFKWIFAIKSLHNALIEDSLDKIENNFSEEKKHTEWNLWVRILRKLFASKSVKK